MATKGYRYFLSILSGLCRGPIDELVEIKVGEQGAWAGHACDPNSTYRIAQPDLFGGEDKEGGIDGAFRIFMGGPDQVLPNGSDWSQDGAYVNNPRASIGGPATMWRGVVTLWYDGMVSAMTPYLKEWRYRVRRTKAGWYGGVAWYPEKCAIYLGGDNFTVASNQPAGLVVAGPLADGSYTVRWTRNPKTDDVVTISGRDIKFRDDDAANTPGEVEINKNKAKTLRRFRDFVNNNGSVYKAVASYDGNSTVTLRANKSLMAIKAMNAAHIVYQCFTDPDWGRGAPLDDIDEPSFIASANRLCAENFGIALIWYRKEDIDVFVQRVCDLVGAASYTDRETGKMCFKLIRDDYDPATVPLYTPETGLLSLKDDNASAADAYSEIIGTSIDPVSNQNFQMRAQNLALYQSQQSISSFDKDYKGIPTKELLARVLQRDMKAMASGLKKYTVTLDRRAWRVTPGSVIRVSHPARNIKNVILRVVEVDDGDLVNGSITLKTAVDVFGLPDTAIVGVADNGWVAPTKVAVPAPEERLVEASYRDLFMASGRAEAEAAVPTRAYVGQVALAPNATSMEYELHTKTAAEASYSKNGYGPFTGAAVLKTDVDATTRAIPLRDLMSFATANIGEAILIGDELMRLDAISAEGVATVTRGIGDTVPAPHLVEDIAWTIDDDLVGDTRPYAVGDVVSSKVLTRTATQLLDLDEAEEHTVTLVGRHALPYPPADVKVGGVSIYADRAAAEVPVLTWSERNRLTQADGIVGYFDATVTPEAGTTYRVRVLDDKGVEIRVVNDIAEPTWTYTAALQLADGSPSSVTLIVDSMRDGLASYQVNRFEVVLTAGWGYGWGENWGGN